MNTNTARLVGREQRGDRHEVRPGARVPELAQRRAADAETGREIEQDAQAQRHVAEMIQAISGRIDVTITKARVATSNTSRA
ncbi:hypothetical protein ACLBXO_20670 [Methylobacterium sp. C33D]